MHAFNVVIMLQHPPMSGEFLFRGIPGPKGEKGDRGEQGPAGQILSPDGEVILGQEWKGDNGGEYILQL